MTRKQKKTLARIIISAVLYGLLLVLYNATGILSAMPFYVRPVMFFVPYIIIGYDILIKAARNIANGQIFDENFLMAIATIAAFFIGEFSESVAVMLFYQIGELFQSYAVGKSRQSIAKMMELSADFANALRDGQIVEADPEDIRVGEIIVVKSGEKIPLDGRIIKGTSFVDTAALTGESVPKRVDIGNDVYSGCINGEGTLHIEVTKEYEDGTVAKILDLVENASEKKARLENFITRFARYYTPVVTIGALLIAVIPSLMLGGAATWIKRACIFLIVSCPCALVISVPLGFFGGIGAAGHIGVLVKGGNYLEVLAKVRQFVFDKTGTITRGEFEVLSVETTEDYAAEKYSADSLLELAARLEAFSTHPIARAIARGAEISQDNEAELSDVSEIPGRGIAARLGDTQILAGSLSMMKDNGIDVPAGEPGHTIVYLAAGENKDFTYIGRITLGDRIKDKSREAIRSLKVMGIERTVMLTGDVEQTAAKVAAEVGLDEYVAELLPQEKVRALEELMIGTDGNIPTAYAGDGINDAPVLMRSDVGIAMGSLGSDAAIEAADIVLMDDDMTKLASTVGIAKKTVAIVRMNIVFALGVKLLVLCLGAFGMANMWEAVFADVGVAVLCIINSMRLLNEA